MRICFSDRIQKTPHCYHNMWQSFLDLLWNNNASRKYRGEIIWKLTPQKWRHWYIHKISNIECYRVVTTETPPVFYFSQVNGYLEVKIQHWKSQNVYKYVSHKWSFVCQYMLCPWDLTKFINKCGHVDIYIYSGFFQITPGTYLSFIFLIRFLDCHILTCTLI